jgi:hypothetical protein
MMLKQIRTLAIAVNDARLEGRSTREVYAHQVQHINRELRLADLSWEDLA